MRRGEVNVLMLLVVLILVLLVSLGVFDLVREIYDEAEADASCASQVRAHAAAVSATREIGTIPITCPTRVLTVEEQGANALLAKEMKRCWDQWGRGELRLFGDKGGTYCHVCSSVTVTGAEFTSGLPEYLDMTAIGNANTTYAQYLAGRRIGTYFDGQEFRYAAKMAMRTDKPVGVIFHYEKGMRTIDKVANALVFNPGAGAAAGGVAGGIIVASFGGGPVTTVAGVAAGGTLGLTGVFLARQQNDVIASVVVRPLGVEELELLGCQYLPVANG